MTLHHEGGNPLSPREIEVLAHIVAGKRTKATAAALNISPRTVESHRRTIALKLGARNVADVVRIALLRAKSDIPGQDAGPRDED